MKVEMPKEVKRERKLIGMGCAGPDKYNEWHEKLAKESLESLKLKGLMVHKTWMASDGWMDGVNFLHVLVELPALKRTREESVLKIKFSSGQSWYIHRCGWVLASIDYPELFEDPKSPPPPPPEPKKPVKMVEVKITFRSAKKSINAFLKKHGVQGDVGFYTPKAWKDRNEPYGGGKESVLVMTFEGPFYAVMNTFFESEHLTAIYNAFDELMESLGCWYELGNAWNLTLYKKD